MTEARRPADAVDDIIGQWRRERPDLMLDPMATIGRLKRCAALMQLRLDESFAAFDLNRWEFDVLATLRRAGAPYRLAPTTLFSSLMITSGTMTHRLQRLEARGLVQRLPNPQDARSLLVQLTADGLGVIDRAVAAHVDNERRILAPVMTADRAALDAGLVALLAALEPHTKA